MTKYAVIAAIDENNGFSKDGEIPWYFSEDFKHFRNITLGNICVTGRKTYDDINKRLGPKAAIQVLPGRVTIVLSSTLGRIQNAVTARSWEDVLDFTFNEKRTVFFIGGMSIFEEGLLIADEVYLTIVPGDYECDLFFPRQYVINNFTTVSEEKTETGLTFIKMARKPNDAERDKTS